MIRIVKYLFKDRVGLLHTQRFPILRNRGYATDQPPSNESNNQIPGDEPTEDIQQRLYTGGPLHPRGDQTPPLDNTEESAFTTDDETEEVSKHEAEDGIEGILEGLYTNEPMHLRVDQIQRDANEIEMMGNQLDHEKLQQNSSDELPPSADSVVSALKQREERSERYFPKLKKPPRASILNELKVETVIRSYWSRGHLAALIDPLYIARQPMFRPEFPSRRVLRQHRVPVDRETHYHLLPDDATTLGGGYSRTKLGKLMKRLNKAYCSTIGVEFSYVHDQEAKYWIKDRIETVELRFMHRDQLRYCIENMIKTETFSEFLKDKVPKEQVRYIALGSETSLLGVDLLIERAVKKHNARLFILGMRRLGRVNLLANVFKIDPTLVYSLVQSDIGKSRNGSCLGIHSVGHSSFLKGVKRSLILMSSCSIPQNFYPLTLGFTKAIQMRQNDEFGEKTWPIIIHMAKGLTSQGIVYETLKLNQLKNYETFGTIHVIFNNQMEETIKRETHMHNEYCTDALRTLNIPVFHVNGDDLVAVHFIMRLAADFREHFRRDVAVDIVSYSRFMTQRVLTKYEFIKVQQAIMQTEPVVKKYVRELIKEGAITQAEVEHWRKDALRSYADAWQKAAKESTGGIDMEIWHSQMFMDVIRNHVKKTENLEVTTGVDRKILEKICDKISTVPETMKLCPKNIGLLKRRKHLIETDKMDWVICEALAYGSWLLEGGFVRLSGMDVNRRLHILESQSNRSESYELLNNLAYEQGQYTHCKSTTSQYATAAFEYGYSCATLRTLVVWEAPEGDKTSKAQVVIDHYLAGGYLKYNYHSNIVFLIPHYHRCETASKVCNGRPERFLQLANDCETDTEVDTTRQYKNTNMILANVSTPANFFHILRRQIKMAHRRPLVVFTPNLLISSAECKAQMKELETGFNLTLVTRP
ncbi:2-oxoglutarate dehydrogenase, mitochondrial isoform X2 [Halyomorpha halys]|uniref:2-oxoglutarate dehydrogenase, mitochondrial isoform X2 n=1 Tax=Halyomorpha halys TaxID=286706 RepID=UPI0006D4D7FA|nr:2-oxoglutarate dehydrogenase, mitochondrial isoform X2 [Halyomorpha halys]